MPLAQAEHDRLVGLRGEKEKAAAAEYERDVLQPMLARYHSLRATLGPSYMDIQAIVATGHPNADSLVGEAFATQEDVDFYYSGRVGTQTKLQGLREACNAFQPALPEACRPKTSEKTFGLQKLFCRPSSSSPSGAFRIISDIIFNSSAYALGGSKDPELKRRAAEDRARGIPHARLRRGRALPPLLYDLKVTVTPRNKFVLCIPCSRQFTRRRRREGEDAARNSCLTIDPGVRTFASAYDVDADAELQMGTKGELLRRSEVNLREADRFKRLASAAPENSQARRDATKRQVKLNYRTRNIVTDFHTKLASHLVGSYGLIVIGAGCTCQGKMEKLPPETRRLMRVWRHAAFRDRLVERAAGEDDVRVVVQDERWTTKTCTRCAWMDLQMTGEKTFECRKCGLNIDRDTNGALNILKRFYFEK